MNDQIKNSVNACVKAAQQLQTEEAITFIDEASKMVAQAFMHGKKVITAGNGGSLCDAAHLAEELTGQFRAPRPALPALALNDPGHITCVGNDYGFDQIFSRGIEAFGQPGDVFIALTTSGNSANILKAVNQAKQQGLKTVAFLGKNGGALKGVADLEWIVSGFETSDRIQEAHMAAIHVIIEMVEEELFSKGKNLLNKMVACSADGNRQSPT